MKQERIIYLEKLRVFALMFVLYTHNSQSGLLYFLQPRTKAGYAVSLALYPVAHCCVVLFFMLSGALLLGKRESLKRLYCHRVAPMAAVTVLAVLLQYVQNCIDYDQPFELTGYLRALYSGGSVTQHWFLYAYLSFLMLLPFLRSMAAAMEDASSYRYLFLLMVVCSAVFPMWEAFTDWDKVGLSFPMLENILFYPLMGYYLHRKQDCFLRTKRLLLADAAGVALVAVNYFMNTHSLAYGGEAVYNIHFLPVYACLIFLNFRQFGNGEKLAPFWKMAGAGVFGTYLLEPQLRHLFKPALEAAQAMTLEYLANWLVLLFMAILSMIVVNLLKKLPGVKILL